MSDLFSDKHIKPMLIGAEEEAFDSRDYIYELKLDGERCVAYLDPDGGTDLRNKRNMKMLPKVPELAEIHRHVKCRCILDGELAVIKDGKPDFSEIQRRSIMDNPLKIELASRNAPACFTAFDILYYEDHPVNLLPLTERKKLLEDVVLSESPRFAKSRYIEEKGIAFYALAEQQDLEGIVAKHKDSLYYFDKRTKDWIKCKNMKDDDFVVCGYIPKENHMTSLVLGQYSGDRLVCVGYVTLGVGGENFRWIKALSKRSEPTCVYAGGEPVHWVEPSLVCTVEYMMKNESGSIRLIHFPDCRMVTSGTGFFGDDNFTRFEKLLAAEVRTTPYPMDFLTGNEHGMEWLCLYLEGMDTFGMNVIDFRGGLYAVVCGIDAQSNAEEMTATEEFMEKHGLMRDDSRPDMGHIVGNKEIQAVLGYEQMDYWTPVKKKEDTK